MRRLFICYGHAEIDRSVMAWLKGSAEDSGWRVWTDQNLQAADGAALNAEIDAALSRSAAVALIASAMSLSSKYCKAELTRAMALGKPLFRLDIEEFDDAATPPEDPAALLTAAAEAPIDPGECQRAWDCEGRPNDVSGSLWERASERLGFAR